MRDIDRLEDQLPRGRGVLRAQFHRADALAPFPPLYAQLLERADPALVARAARLHALADPDLFLRQFLVEECGRRGLDLQGGPLLKDIGVVAAGPGAQLAAVEFDYLGGQAAYEGAV